ncbi:hypothetical protein BG015_004127 [Linnemannia schmuckeri]|uniref:HMG box domain-containing protein n=1 Tax=Linnemannia schmuckeri TaxID=64567 RepID=A0A9P5VD59_9FUNG|nr:hypothetical protein BG015_004127 [Linnemannia schmuckeri]
MAKSQRISVSKAHASHSKRQSTAYNLYIKNELPKYKAAHPNVEHKLSNPHPTEAFRQVAYLWKYAAENSNRTPL